MRTKGLLLKLILPAVLGIVVLIAIAGMAVSTYVGPLFDLEAVDDADLRLSKRPIPASTNAFFALERIKEPVIPKGVPFDRLVDGSSWDAVAVRKILDSNIAPIATIRAVADARDYQSAALFAKDPTTAPVPPFFSVRKAAELFSLQAFVFQKQGKDKEALDEAFVPLRLATKMQGSQITLGDYLTAGSIKLRAYSTIQAVASESSSITPADYGSYIRQLDRAENQKEGLIAAIKFEYRATSVMVDMIAAGDHGEAEEFLAADFGPFAENGYSFQPNRTKDMFARFYRMPIQAIDRKCSRIAADSENLERQAREAGVEHPLGYFQPNSMGKMFFLIAMPNYDSTATKMCDHQMTAAMTKTMLAVKMFRLKTGRHPVTLQELVPTYLTSVPDDPYGEGPIRYDAEKKRIYSVGRDGDEESTVQLRF